MDLTSYEIRALVKRAAKSNFDAATVDRLIQLANELKIALAREQHEAERARQQSSKPKVNAY